MLSQLYKHWRHDLTAGITVALVALPLGLGIAIASDAPPMAGITSAIAGGLVATWFRGSHVAINGPANSLIIVVATGLAQLKTGADPLSAMAYLAAAVVLVGAIQVLLGLLRVGQLAAYVPSSVLYGMLAAIGIVICAKQGHVALGWHSKASSGLGDLLTLPQSIAHFNPIVLTIAALSLLILLVHPRLKSTTIHYVPAPLLVLAVAIPLAWAFGFGEAHQREFLGRTFEIGPHLLVNLPHQLQEAIIFPNFGQAHRAEFWMLVGTLTFMASLESLLSCKAVDRLDPEKRKSDLNRDLIGNGLATMASGALGGLPVVTVIARSTVNVTHGARTGWSNFFHGLVLLGLVLTLSGVIREVPLAALAAVLIFAGYKLTAPKIFREAYWRGKEQLLALVVTLLTTLELGLLKGIGLGILTLLVCHWWMSGLSPWRFLQESLTGWPTARVESEGKTHLRMGRVANFLNLPWLNSSLPKEGKAVVDFSGCHLVDSSTLEYLEERKSPHLEVIGLAVCRPVADHPLALRRRHVQTAQPQSLSSRQTRLAALAERHDWTFHPERDWDCGSLAEFHFFRGRPLLFRKNVVQGEFPELAVSWLGFDLTFDEGVYLAAEEHHLTVYTLELPFEIPVFTLSQTSYVENLLSRAGVLPDYPRYTDFPEDWLVTGPDQSRLAEFFTAKLVSFIDEEEYYHLESTGRRLLLFHHQRLATPREWMTGLHYCENLARVLLQSGSRQTRGADQENL